jgi:hypothetical protein
MVKLSIREKELLGKYKIHADQLGFAFAIIELRIPLESLEIKYNFPGHFKQLEVYKDYLTITPKVIHYHWEIDSLGKLNLGLFDNWNSAIEKINLLAQSERKEWSKLNFLKSSGIKKNTSKLNFLELLKGLRKIKTI